MQTTVEVEDIRIAGHLRPGPVPSNLFRGYSLGPLSSPSDTQRPVVADHGVFQPRCPSLRLSSLHTTRASATDYWKTKSRPAVSVSDRKRWRDFVCSLHVCIDGTFSCMMHTVCGPRIGGHGRPQGLKAGGWVAGLASSDDRLGPPGLQLLVYEA